MTDLTARITAVLCTEFPGIPVRIAQAVAAAVAAELNLTEEPQRDGKCPPPPPHTDSDGWSIYGRPE